MSEPCVLCPEGRVRYVGRVEPNRRHLFGCDRCGVQIVEANDGPHARLLPARTAEDLYVLAALTEIRPGAWIKGPDGSWEGPEGVLVSAKLAYPVWAVRGDKQITRPLRRLLQVA